MKFSIAVLTAALGSTTLAAPNSLTEFANPTQMPNQVLERFNSRDATPGPAANFIALDDRDGNLRKTEKRANTHLYICKDIHFAGPCQNLEVSRGTCYGFGNGWDKEISSLGPDTGTVCCIWEYVLHI
ncbi:uncharacterized protein BP5553_05187 [Venustampulla echinocandica]|uniref:Uncharacterized protein n=1 Tax=Venustampulla echinocandica TaxID=2656787 RepID=A0A370TQG3_9HELO|nr:uncharacterized protein BP5553_05187 [Venustampulla echinocandica]RDL37754.1 hypothetical protein BP5553_05187 [Venustampulla echinocandica]